MLGQGVHPKVVADTLGYSRITTTLGCPIGDKACLGTTPSSTACGYSRLVTVSPSHRHLRDLLKSHPIGFRSIPRDIRRLTNIGFWILKLTPYEIRLVLQH